MPLQAVARPCVVRLRRARPRAWWVPGLVRCSAVRAVLAGDALAQLTPRLGGRVHDGAGRRSAAVLAGDAVVQLAQRLGGGVHDGAGRGLAGVLAGDALLQLAQRLGGRVDVGGGGRAAGGGVGPDRGGGDVAAGGDQRGDGGDRGGDLDARVVGAAGCAGGGAAGSDGLGGRGVPPAPSGRSCCRPPSRGRLTGGLRDRNRRFQPSAGRCSVALGG